MIRHSPRLAAAALACALASAAHSQPPMPPTVTKVVMTHPLVGAPGKEVTLSEVSRGPGAGSAPHRHDANTFVYVLEGKVEMQVQGGPLLTLGPGEVFYESPSDIHIVSRNASATAPATILVVFVKQAGAPTTVPVH
ncbi:MAG TPA: cupin domain-containing protein [Caulobacteraceae bacterium]|nr:cupin domain-containing protein [Caulobacteraceae bacterium]